jgi:hypothetical protein
VGADRLNQGEAMSGQMVIYESVWMAQRRGPAIQLNLNWPSLNGRPGLEAAGRIGVGGAVGALFGATTSYFGLWVVIGVAVGGLGNWIMSRK